MSEKNIGKIRIDLFFVSYVILFTIIVFNIFTYIQSWYNFGINVILVILFVLVTPTDRETKYNLLKESGIWAGMIVCISIALLVTGRYSEVFEIISGHLHVVLSIICFLIFKHIYSKSQSRILFFGITVVVLVGSIATLTVLLGDTNASRLLAGAATQEQRNLYYQLGVGGYGYVYFLVFFNYAALLCVKNGTRAFEKVFYIICLVVNILVVIISSYTTAILLEIILVALFLANSKKRNKTIVIFLIIAVGLFLLRDTIFGWIKGLADNWNLYYVSRRMEQLLLADEFNTVSGLRRSTLYLQSLQSFWDNPLFGGADVGGHSQMLDALGRFGLVGISYISYFAFRLRKIGRLFSGSTVPIMLTIFFAFSFVDRIDSREIIMGIFLVVPMFLMCSEMNDKSTEIKNDVLK